MRAAASLQKRHTILEVAMRHSAAGGLVPDGQAAYHCLADIALTLSWIKSDHE